jgi:Galactose oxidase, central domain
VKRVGVGLEIVVAVVLVLAAPAAAAAPLPPLFTGVGLGALVHPGDGAAMAPLADGRVLYVGGAFGSPSTETEVFNPSSDQFSLGPVLHTARIGAVAAPLPNGGVLVAGGQNAIPTPDPTAEVLDPRTGAFVDSAHQMTKPRFDAAAALLHTGQVLIVGPDASAELYDPATDAFSGVGSMSGSRLGPVAVTLGDGTVLVAGGADSGGHALPTAELYHPENGTFTPVAATMSTGRVNAAAALLPDGKVLIAGGLDSNGLTSDSADIYDPATQTFSMVSVPMTTPRDRAAAAPLPDGRVLIGGGFNAGTLASAEVYLSPPEARITGGQFGTVALGQTPAPQQMSQQIIVTNVGARPLRIDGIPLPVLSDRPGSTGLTIDPGTCEGAVLALRQSCTAIAHVVTGTELGAASLDIPLDDNEPTPSSVHLAATVVAGTTGPAGTPGQNGVQGQVGASGQNGAPGKDGATGKVQLVTCTTKTITKKVHGHRKTQKKTTCTSKTVTGPVKFTTTKTRATLSRRGVIYATGTASGSRVTLLARRTIRPGTYTLTIGTGHQRRSRQVRYSGG